MRCCYSKRLKKVQYKKYIASLENNLEAGDVSLSITGSIFDEQSAAALMYIFSY